MNLLIVVSNYPHAGHLYSGVFNERSVRAISGIGHHVEVLAPRPYVPPRLGSWSARWQAYEKITGRETRAGVIVHRPAYLQLPRLGGAFWVDPGAYFWSVQKMKRRHQKIRFDAILSFGLVGAGGLAWRLGRVLGIPAAGWATGTDVRVPASSSYGRAVRLALRRLDVVFYQSRELLQTAATLCGVAATRMASERHVVLARGIERPPVMPEDTRARVRAELGLNEEQVAVLFVGRVVRAKGIFELTEAIGLAGARHYGIRCLMVGSKAGFDETEALRKKLCSTPSLAERIRLLPECSPNAVWDYLCAADVFVFPSHNEGMPNSLLEAMAAGLPAIAYAIPPIEEIDRGMRALKTVPPGDVEGLAQAILELADSSEDRRVLAEKGREQVLARFMTRDRMAEAVQKLGALKEARKARPRFLSGSQTAPVRRALESSIKR